MRFRRITATALFATCLCIDACATTDTSTNATTEPGATSSSEENPRPRHRRRRHLDENGNPIESGTAQGEASAENPASNASNDSEPSSASPAPLQSTSSFGSPIVAPRSQEVQVNPHWIVEGSRARLVCEGNETRPQPPTTPQSPREPSNAAVVRAFIPYERDVLACEPPTNTQGRFPMRVTFGSAGYPLEIAFPGVDISRRTARCVGRSLCFAHVPIFRNIEAVVDYDFVVLVPESQ